FRYRRSRRHSVFAQSRAPADVALHARSSVAANAWAGPALGSGDGRGRLMLIAPRLESHRRSHVRGLDHENDGRLESTSGPGRPQQLMLAQVDAQDAVTDCMLENAPISESERGASNCSRKIRFIGCPPKIRRRHERSRRGSTACCGRVATDISKRLAIEN